MLEPLDIAGRTALYAQDAERSVLGGIVQRIERGEGRAVYAVNEDDFWLPNQRRIYKAIRSMYERKEPVDLITLDAELMRLYPNDTATISPDLLKSVCEGMYYYNFEQYVEMLKQASIRRKLAALADRIATSARDVAEDMTVLIDKVRAELRDMIQTQSAWRSMTDVMMATFDDIEKRQKGEIVGIKSGVYDIDRATGGFFPGELAVIGARPSVGKSAFGLQIAVEAAAHGHKVCFVSCEMVDSQFGQRLISNTAKIDGMKLRTAKLENEDWALIGDALGPCASLPISFTFGAKTIEDLRNDVQRKVDIGECDLVVIDYLQLLKTRRRFDIEHERVGYISHALKQMTTDFKIPVVALAQAKRQNNNGRARCPVLDDLRASGDIEQDADTVIFLHRPDDSFDPAINDRDKPYFDTLTQNGLQYIAFSVAKQRQGQTGIIGAVFDPAHMRYLSMDRVRDKQE